MKELGLSWKNRRPVKLYSGLRMPQFEVEQVTASVCQESFQIGNYSCIKAEYMLRRAVGFHLVQSYLPTMLIVVISWVSFWMDVDSVPGRTTLGVTTLLTMSTKASGVQMEIPQVSYVKAIDVWMGACTAFIFAALLEFTLVNYFYRKDLLMIQKEMAHSCSGMEVKTTSSSSRRDDTKAAAVGEEDIQLAAAVLGTSDPTWDESAEDNNGYLMTMGESSVRDVEKEDIVKSCKEVLKAVAQAVVIGTALYVFAAIALPGVCSWIAATFLQDVGALPRRDAAGNATFVVRVTEAVPTAIDDAASGLLTQLETDYALGLATLHQAGYFDRLPGNWSREVDEFFGGRGNNDGPLSGTKGARVKRQIEAMSPFIVGMFGNDKVQAQNELKYPDTGLSFRPLAPRLPFQKAVCSALTCCYLLPDQVALPCCGLLGMQFRLHLDCCRCFGMEIVGLESMRAVS
ncbi:unnamed protein product [Notodromas monacha]|uniref:Neurotransmitter-gated ion-channel transmembrane domain-containing protein n=1 Tax=Notodromas monacha TaxID=399045 RepID=A0A7R9BUC7_9CRUS|nr:unnamed protein product [Notodromas monacha]CAG0921923.1 unnamed protein product [Notodromas monacha]